MRPRCPRCWYDLRNAEAEHSTGDGLVCPECGRVIIRRKDLLRSRRDWRQICLAGIVLGGSYGMHCVPRMRMHRQDQAGGAWTAFLPTSLLILAPLPRRGAADPLLELRGQDGAVWRELLARHHDDGADPWHWQNAVLGARVRRHLQQTTDFGIRPEERATFARLVTTSFGDQLQFEGDSAVVDRIRELTGVGIRIQGNLNAWCRGRVPLGTTHLWSVLDAGTHDWPMSCQSASADWTIDGSDILIAPSTDLSSSVRTMVYDTTDLVTSSDDATRFLDLVCDTLEPQHWIRYGGSIGDLGFIADHLVVRTSVRNHLAIERVLATLRGQQPCFALHAPYVVHDPDNDRARAIPVVTRAYEIGDLAPTPEESTSLEATICTLLDPGHWRRYGGEVGAIHHYRSWLVVTSTSGIQAQVEQLLAQIRNPAPPGHLEGDVVDAPSPIDPFSDSPYSGLQIRTYAVRSIAPEPRSMEPLAAHLMSTINAKHWHRRGGPGRICWHGDRLVTLASEATHESIAQCLAKLDEQIREGRTLEDIVVGFGAAMGETEGSR